MTYEILWSDGAMTGALAYASGDRAGLLAVFDRVDELSIDPRPAGAFAWGEHLLRLWVGRYRIVYRIRDETAIIEIIHLGRGA